MIAGQHLTRAAKARLDFIGNEEHIRFAANGVSFREIAIVRNNHASFALNRLYQKARHILIRNSGLQSREVVVRNGLIALRKGAEVGA